VPFFSTFYGVEVRDAIAQEFTDSFGNVDDMMAGLHEIRARLAEEDPWLKQLHNNLKKHTSQKKRKTPDKSVGLA